MGTILLLFKGFEWVGWNAISAIAVAISTFFIWRQSYFTRKVFEFQFRPSVAFSLMSNKTLHEKTHRYNIVESTDTHFMIYNLSNFPISFWIQAKDGQNKEIFRGGPWRINPQSFFKPHTTSILDNLLKSQQSEAYILISYSPLNDEGLKVSEGWERWRIADDRWMDRHGMLDVYDKYWDKFLSRLNQETDRKGTA
jgi:hypothetical protein